MGARFLLMAGLAVAAAQAFGAVYYEKRIRYRVMF